MGKNSSRKKEIVKENGWTTVNILSLIFSIGYLCVDFISHFGKYVDVIYPQWFYLSTLTLVCLGFTFYFKDSFQPVFSLLIKDKIVRLFALFLLISAISLMRATNIPEGLIDLSRIILTFFIFIFLSIFIHQLRDKFHILAKVVLFILLYQSVEGLFEFYNNAGSLDLKTLFKSIADDFANKNVMAIALLIKIPFVLFVLNNSKKFIWKLLSAITLIPAISLIFILNARSAYIGFCLISLIYLTAQIISFFKINRKVPSLKNPAIIAVMIVISLLALVLTNNVLVKHREGSDYGTVFERIKTINFNNSSGRILYWQEGLKLFKENLIGGVGEGNFKIDYLKYGSKHITDSLVYPRRLHNDFLEVAIETGIFGGLCYLSIFLFILMYFTDTLKKKRSSFTQELSLLSFLAAAAYMVDAFFNFPLERSNMQVYFGLFLAINVISHLDFDSKKNDLAKTKWRPLTWVPPAMILLCIYYINFITLQSSAAQFKYRKDKNNLTQKADDVAMQFPAFPTIDFAGQSIRSIKATYYANEKRFSEALDVLNKGENPSPYFFVEDLLRVKIFMAMGQLDSAMHYALIGSKKGPEFYLFANKAIQIALKKGDLETAIKVISNFTQRTSNNALAWVNYAELVNIQTRDYNKVYKVLKDGLWYNPKNKILLEKMHSFIMSIKDNQKKLAELQNYNLMSTTSYSLATRALWREDHNTAIKHLSILINLREFNNGLSEFDRGLCFLELGQAEKACADFQASAEKNFPKAQRYLDQCSK